MTDGRLKVGIAGYGVVGKRRRQFIDAHPNLHTVAVSEQQLDDHGTFEDGVRYHPDFRDLYGEDLDIMLVCLSNDVAAEATAGGLDQGFHVFCEKPPGRTLEEVADVVRAEARNPGRKLMYGFNHRHHDSVRAALDLVDGGELGKVINLRGLYGKSQLISYGQTTWRTERALAGGGILLDQGIHMVDLLRLFAGEFTEVHSFISNDFWRHDVEDNAYALMRTDAGVVAILHSSATQWRHRFQLEVTLERGSITLSGILSGSKSYGAETMTIAWAADDDRGDPREQMTEYNEDPSWEREIAEFADVVLTDRPVTSGSSADALATMKLVYDIYCADPRWRREWNLNGNVSL